MADQGSSTDTTTSPAAGSVSSPQPGAAPLTVFAAPTTGTELNTLGERLVPKGCFKAEDLLFAFDSSFIRPEIKQHLPNLAQLRNSNRVKDSAGNDVFPPLSIFGHADPEGDDNFNKVLSGRRATSFYALLVRDTDLWEKLFGDPVGGDNWGVRSIQIMLSEVQAPIAVDGKIGDETRGAIRDFQKANGLSADGVAGKGTRKVLFRAYMDALCGPDLKLDKTTDFLARHKDGDGGKGDIQGCSKFNPLRVFSKSETAAFAKASDKTERNQENAPNRRVTVLLFAPGRRVNPGVWPCPRVSEGVANCKKRFYPDADVRRNPGSSRREFEDTQDTFGCRFYQIITDDSPCERVKPAPPDTDIVGPLIAETPDREPETKPVAAQDGAPAPTPAAAPGAAPAASSGELFAGPTTTPSDSPDDSAPDSASGAGAASTPAAAPVDASGTGAGSGAGAAPAPPPAPDPPIVGPEFGFVMVRHDTTAPRQAFRLTVDKTFDGKGTLTISPAGKIKFFKPGKGEIKFTGGDNIFDGAELSKPGGVLLFGEGVTPSQKKDDVLLTLTLSGGSKKVKPPATMKLTCVELILDICNPPLPGKAPVPLPVPDKLTKGATVFAQGDLLASRRAVLIVRPAKPANLNTTLLLHTLSGKVDTFEQQAPAKNQKALSGVIELKTNKIPAAGRHFFVQGRSGSKKDADETYHLGILTNALGTLLVDNVAVTVIEQDWKGKIFFERKWDYDTSNAIPAIKEFLPMAKVELHGKLPGDTKDKLIDTTFLDEDGKFLFFRVPELDTAFFRVFLEHKDKQVVRVRGQAVKGNSTPVNLPDFKVKAGQTVSFDQTIDPTLFKGKKDEVDFADFKVGTEPFTHYADAYKSVWFGHKRLLELTESEANAPLCMVNVPQPKDDTSRASDEMFLLESDLQDRDVILHEYGHFIGQKFLKGLANLGYRFNDEPAPGTHGPGSTPFQAEHYESAWDEGYATFFSCALRDKPTYRDGHEGPTGTGGFTFNLTGNGSTWGAHNEASVQEALWRITKVHNVNFKKGFWTAFMTAPKAKDPFTFFDNWKAANCPDKDKVIEAYKSRGMEFGFSYADAAADQFTAVAAPKAFDAGKKQFRTMNELFTNFGNLAPDTAVNQADYDNEFYNRNRALNSAALGAGSSVTVDAANNITTTVNVVAGRKYIVPRRRTVKP